MSTILHTSINFCPTSVLGYGVPKRPIICFSLPRLKVVPFHLHNLKASNFTAKESILGHGVFVGEDGELKRDGSCNSRRRRVVIARFNKGFDFNGGDGGGKDNGINSRVVGNLVLAIGLTYLSMTGQLCWVLDTIVPIWGIHHDSIMAEEPRPPSHDFDADQHGSAGPEMNLLSFVAPFPDRPPHQCPVPSDDGGAKKPKIPKVTLAFFEQRHFSSLSPKLLWPSTRSPNKTSSKSGVKSSKKANLIKKKATKTKWYISYKELSSNLEEWLPDGDC